MFSKKAVPIGIIYFIILVGMITVTLLLAANITAKLILSLLFVIIPLTVMFLSICHTVSDNQKNVTQNNAITIATIFHLIAAVIASILLNFIPVGMKIYLAVEIVILFVGILIVILSYYGKKHIEG